MSVAIRDKYRCQTCMQSRAAPAHCCGEPVAEIRAAPRGAVRRDLVLVIGCNPGQLTRARAYRYVYENVQDRGRMPKANGSTYLRNLTREVTRDERTRIYSRNGLFDVGVDGRATLSPRGLEEFDRVMGTVADLGIYTLEECEL